MVRDTKPPLGDVQADAQRAVEQTMGQARLAVDNYFNFVQKIIHPILRAGQSWVKNSKAVRKTTSPPHANSY